MNKIIRGFFIAFFPIFLFSFLCSGTVYLLYRRIVNEPGIFQDYSNRLRTAVVLFLMGIFGTISIFFAFKKYKEKTKALIIGGLIAVIIYIPIFLFSLLLLV